MDNRVVKVTNANGDTVFSYKYDISDQERFIVKITAVDIEGVEKVIYGKNY